MYSVTPALSIQQEIYNSSPGHNIFLMVILSIFPRVFSLLMKFLSVNGQINDQVV